MSGHSKWATTKRKKAKIDQARAKSWTRVIKEIIVSARIGGEDPDANPRLRLAVTKAKAANMPAKNIETAILKGAGKLEGQTYEEAVYEGHGPAGVAIIIECLTDNKNRTVGELRNIFTKNGGSMAESGSVAWMFDRKGKVAVSGTTMSEDEATELALDVGGDDVQEGEEEGVWEILTAPNDLAVVTKAVEAKGLTISDSAIVRIAKETVKVSDEDAPKVLRWYDLLDDQDDVQNLYVNFEVSDAALEAE